MPNLSRMLSASEKLPADQRKLFEALYSRGLSIQSAAAELGKSVADIETMRSTMLRSLRAAS
ncbi:MAG: hypothetical protein E6Q67_03200 [Roseateles sp.]|nr:MAG: hypothetical protein E6Q67_03200 [Roseateles sp.]